MKDEERVDFYELFRASEACLRQIGLPDVLGGPHLPAEVNRLIAATSAIRRRQIEAPEGWCEPVPFGVDVNTEPF